MIMCMRLHTSFQQDNLVVLREAHETRYHLCELNDLRDDRRQFLCRLHPQALLGLKSRKGNEICTTLSLERDLWKMSVHPLLYAL